MPFFYIPILALTIIVLNYSFESFVASHNYILFFIIKYFLAFLLLVVIIYRIRHLWKIKRLTNIAITLYSLLLTFLIAEIIFTGFSRSHHAEFSYAGIIWVNRFYHLNEQGWRDQPVSTKDHRKTALVFCGDSYTAGYGLGEVNERYSEIVGKNFQDDYQFYNVGIKGAGLEMALKQIEKIPNVHKYLIYQIYINDLEDFCDHFIDVSGLDLYNNFTKLDGLIVRSSFLLNYIYFNFRNDRIIENYYTFFNQCAQDTSVYNRYLAELDRFLYRAENELGYQHKIIVFIPTLADLSFNTFFEKSVKSHLEGDSSLIFLSVTDLVKDWEVKDRVVSYQDTHAGKLLNKKIAEELISIIDKMEVH